MRRVITFSKGFLSVSYQKDGRELGHLHYSMYEGVFTIVVWPSHFSPFTRIREYMKVLRYALKLMQDEEV